MKDDIKVSIICVTYNQEKYIEQALRGFISQKTNFKIEVIVADDSSTDKTPEIIANFAKEYPGILKPIFRSKNLGVIANNVNTLKQAKGEYIALCEGDDYWTDPLKLQKQADLLDKHHEMALCFHPVQVIFEGDDSKGHIYPDPSSPRRFNTEHLLKENFIQTNSVMYRRRNYGSMRQDILPLDWFLHLYHAQYGRIGFIDRVMSVYRRHTEGLWWETSQGGLDQIWKKYGVSHLNLYLELLKIYGGTPKYRAIIDNHITGTLNAINRIDETQKTGLLQNYVNNSSEKDSLPTLLSSLLRTIDMSQKSVDQLKTQQMLLGDKIRDMSDEIAHLEQEKEAILQSKTYKVGHKIAKAARVMRVKG